MPGIMTSSSTMSKPALSLDNASNPSDAASELYPRDFNKARSSFLFRSSSSTIRMRLGSVMKLSSSLPGST